MSKHHPWAGIAHHGPDSVFHVQSIAMDDAFAATGFLLTERALQQPPPGIFQQSRAIRTQIPIALFVAAVDSYHLLHRPLFPLNPCYYFIGASCFGKMFHYLVA